MDDKLDNKDPTVINEQTLSDASKIQEKTHSSEPLASASTESGEPQSVDSVLDLSSQPVDSVPKNLDSVPASKPKSEKELVLEALGDAFDYYNWNYSDKERLRYATINTNRKQTKFYERFLFEGNLIFNLAVKLAARKKRLAK